MVGLTFAVLAVVFLGLVVVVVGLALERLVGRDRAEAAAPTRGPPPAAGHARQDQPPAVRTARGTLLVR